MIFSNMSSWVLSVCRRTRFGPAPVLMQRTRMPSRSTYSIGLLGAQTNASGRFGADRLNPHSPDSVVNFGAAFRDSDIAIGSLSWIELRQRWRTRRVNQYRMLFGSISTAA